MNEQAAQEYFLGQYPLPGEKILVIRRPQQLARYTPMLEKPQYFGNVWQGLTGKYKGQSIVILAGGIGPSQVGDAVYALHKPGAVCIFAGTCGSLDPHIQLGAYVVASDAVEGSGYGLTFGQKPFSRIPTNPQIRQTVFKGLSAQGLPVHSGSVFSTGSVVREIDAAFWEYVPESSQVIEMECAAFFIAAAHSRKQSGAFFWVTDLPRHGKSFLESFTLEDSAVKNTRYEAMVEVNLNIIANL